MIDHPPTAGRTVVDPANNRRVFFSFLRDEDINRANVVRDSWQTHNPDGMPAANFVDSTISGEAKALDDEHVKHLIREAIDQTSVTCVLIGTHSWECRWVRYEIARSVERGNGLLSVRINGIADVSTRQTSAAGPNPLAYMGLGKGKDGQYFIYENAGGQWMRYQDHTLPVAKPLYLPDMSAGYVQPLTVGAPEYDYVRQNGPENLGHWIALAAEKAGK